MTRHQAVALAVLAGISLGTGVLLYLAAVTDALPGAPAWISLGGVVIALAALWLGLNGESEAASSET
jgi:hypothetical protein